MTLGRFTAVNKIDIWQPKVLQYKHETDATITGEWQYNSGASLLRGNYSGSYN